VELAPTGIVEGFFFLKPYQTAFLFVISRILNEAHDFTGLSNVFRDINLSRFLVYLKKIILIIVL